MSNTIRTTTISWEVDAVTGAIVGYDAFGGPMRDLLHDIGGGGAVGLSVATGKVLAANNTLTLAGTDGTSLTFQGTGTVVNRDSTDTLTNKTISGGSFTGAENHSGASVLVANAMSGNSIDVAYVLNTKTIAADTSFTISNLTPTDRTTFYFALTNSDTSAHIGTITAPTLFSENRQATFTTFPVPAGGTVVIRFEYDQANTRFLVAGELPQLDNWAATTAPTVNNDQTQGYGTGSIWFDATNKVLWFCRSAGAAAAVWTCGFTHWNSGTWAARPAAGMVAGDTYDVADVGTGLIRHIYGTKNVFGAGNVTRWWPMADFTLTDSGYVNGTASASQQVITSAQFPAGYAWVGMAFDTDVRFSKVSGTTDASTHLTFKVGALGTTGDHDLSGVFDATNKVTAALNECAYRVEWRVASATTLAKEGGDGGGNPSWAGASGSQTAAVTMDTTANAWNMNLCMTMAGATDTPKGAMRIRVKAP